MDEKTILLIIFGVLGYVASFFFGYYLCKSRGLGAGSNVCRELSEGLERDGKQVGDIQQSVEDVEAGLGKLSEEGKRALDIFRKYIKSTNQNSDLEQDSDRVGSSESDIECHSDSPYAEVDDE